MKRVLCIWIPNWPVQRIAAARPELKGRPIVLYETYRGGRRVTACSAQAAALGIAPGMPLAEATAIHPSSLILHPFPADPLADHEALEELAAWCRRFGPIVGIDSPAAPSSSLPPPFPDSLLLDITGLDHLFGGEEALGDKIVEQFAADRGMAVRVAIADTVGAAWAVAHFGEMEISNFKFQIPNSKFQNAKQAPPLTNSSLTPSPRHPLTPSSLLVPPGQTLAALRGLPIEALRLPAKVVELLHPLGIHGIGQLESLPRAEVAARLGASIALRWDQATGQSPEPIPGSPLPAELQVRESLEYPTARREAVEWILQQLIGQVAQKLLDCGRGAMRLQCRLECQSDEPTGGEEKTPPLSRSGRGAGGEGFRAGREPTTDNRQLTTSFVELSVGLFEPTASARHLLQLVQLQLERLSIPAPVVGVAVEVTATAPLVCRQESLFADGPGSTGWLLAGLVDRLANRLGRDCVLRPRLLPEAQPELACRYEPLIGEKWKAESGKRRPNEPKIPLSAFRFPLSSSLTPHPSSFPPRPLRLFRSPHPLSAMSLMPEGPPLRFAFRGHEHRVARAWGPERIETGWWRGRSIGRDYYRLETTSGRRYWLFRRLDDGRWFLHGIFE